MVGWSGVATSRGDVARTLLALRPFPMTDDVNVVVTVCMCPGHVRVVCARVSMNVKQHRDYVSLQGRYTMALPPV